MSVRAFYAGLGIELPDRGKIRCPLEGHDDVHPSFDVDRSTGLWICRTKCDRGGGPYGLALELGLAPNEARELAQRYGLWLEGGAGTIAATYNYVDEDGRLLFQVVRFEPKSFRQRRPNGNNSWYWNLNGTRRVLYRLPRVVEARKRGEDVMIVEGEKDVHALEKIGITATCNPGGAGKWTSMYTDSLLGAKVTIVADRDEPGRDHARQVAEALEGMATEVEAVEPTKGKDIADHLANDGTLAELVPLPPCGPPRDRAAGGKGIEFVTASTVAPANVRWLWRGWVPLGMQSALIGQPGFGKTTLAMLVAARTSKGELDGDLRGESADVLFISYEDVVDVRLRPMAEAADADLDRLHFVKAKKTGDVVDLTSQLPQIERGVDRYGARLLVVDPLVAGLPAEKVNSFRDQDVRSVLAPIAALAEKRDLAALTTGHFTKSAMSALLGTGGSIGFVGAPRSILVFGPDPRDGAAPTARVLGHAKSNVGLKQSARQVAILPHWLDPFGANIGTSRAEIGDQCDVSADDLVNVASGKEAPKVRAARFLRELLADGPHKAAEVFGLAEDEDIAEKTLRRAKDSLGVKAYQQGREWWWRLPTEDEREGDEGEADAE